MYTTLLMSTGLTFGTISALFGLTNHIIDQTQYTILVTAVIGSAVVPTLIAQHWFVPVFKPIEDIQTEQAVSAAAEEVRKMYRKLLIANDGSEGARRALAAAISWRSAFALNCTWFRWRRCLVSRPPRRDRGRSAGGRTALFDKVIARRLLRQERRRADTSPGGRGPHGTNHR